MSSQPMPVPTMIEALRHLWRVVKLMRPYARQLAKGGAMGIGLGLVGMVVPYLSKLYYDRVYPSHDLTLLRTLVVSIFILTATNALLSSLKSFYSSTIGAQLNRSVNLMFFNHLQHLPVSFFDEHRVGEIIGRFGSVSSSIQTVTALFDTLILNGTFLILVPPLLLFMNPTLALVSLIAVPITTVTSTISSRWVRGFSKRYLEVSAELSAFQVETLTHIRTIKGIAAEHAVFQSASQQLYHTMDLQLKSTLLGLVVGFANSIFRGLGQVIFTYVGWSEIIHQQMTLGDFMAFTMYMGYLSRPVGSLASTFVNFQTSTVSFGRMFEYLDLAVEQEPSLAWHPPEPVTRRISGEISLNGIVFGYSPNKPVLRNVTMTIGQGTVNAVVGPSGAGKSSLLRLLCAMERPQAGQISFDDVDIDEFRLPDLRRQIAVVWQDVGLMRGTILDNVTYGLQGVTRDRVEEAIRLCRLSDLIATLPNGLETTVAEWGATLSAGQRQRLAIARALVRDAPILLLDEATSNIDATTESEILGEIFSRVTDKTVLFVTHRISTAAIADRIFVIDGGSLVATGTHRDLIEQSSVYRGLYAAGTQSIDDPRRLRVVSGDSQARH